MGAVDIKGSKIFYGWIIVLAGSIVAAIGLGLFNSTNSIFVKPICDELGFSRAEFTLHRTIITLTSAFLLPVYAKLISRMGVKRIFLFCSIGLGLVTFSYSFASELWHFYVIAAINGLFLNGTSFMIIGILVNLWFDSKKGLATGLAYSGSGLGAAVMVPIFGKFIEYAGWRWSYRAIGILGISILIPIVLFLIKDRPEQMGLKPYRSGQADSKSGSGDSPKAGVTMKEASRTPTFWMLLIAFFLIAVCAGGVNTHTIPYLTDIGYTTLFATSVFSLFMLALTFGKIIAGAVYDKFGTFLGNFFIALSCLLFPIFALVAKLPFIPYLYAVFVGIASAGFSVPVTVLVTNYFGTRDFSSIFSLFTMLTTLGSAVSIPLMGAIYDGTGSYTPAWFMLLAAGAIITICLVGGDLLNRREKKQKERGAFQDIA